MLHFINQIGDTILKRDMTKSELYDLLTDVREQRQFYKKEQAKLRVKENRIIKAIYAIDQLDLALHSDTANADTDIDT